MSRRETSPQPAHTDSVANTPDSFVLHVLAASILVSVASYFRFVDAWDFLVFSTDQARAMLAGRNILLGHFTLTGPETSVPGFHLGPFYYYLTAFALWLSNFDPIGPTLMVSLFGVAAVLLLYFLTQKWWGSPTALVTATIFALSPLAIQQTRIAIEPTPLPFFLLCWLWCIHNWWETGKWRWWGGAFLLVGILLQLNFSAIILSSITGSLLLLRFLKLETLWWRIGVLCSLAFMTTGVLIKFLFFTHTSFAYLWWNWSWLTTPTSGTAAIILFALAARQFGIWSTALWNPPVWKKTLTAEFMIFVCEVWFLLALTAFGIKTVGGEHSLGLLFLAPALLLGKHLGEQWQKYSQTNWSGILLILLFLFWAILGDAALRSQRPFTLTLNDHLPIVERIGELTEGKPYTLVYRGHLDIYDAADDHYQYLLWYKGYPPVQSALREKDSDQQELWLLPEQSTQPSQKTVYLYYPWYAADRYPEANILERIGSTALELVEQ